MTVRRGIFLTGIFVLCAWTLVPLYFIALGAVGGREAVNNWPKAFWPTSVSFTTLREFLNIAGVWTSMLYSVEAAVLCMVFSILLGVPAGYALARFAFRGATTYRLMILLTRAFPVAILALPLTVSFIRLGLYDTPLGVSLMHTALALPFAVLVSASLFQAIPQRVRGGGLGVRLLGDHRLPARCSSTGPAGDRGDLDLRLRDFMERGVRGDRADGAAQDADGLLAERAR